MDCRSPGTFRGAARPRLVLGLATDMRRLLIWSAVVALLAAVPQAQTNIATLGPQVGQRAIDFSLPDQQDRVRTLKSFAGPKGTMLVFFRSADW